MHQLRKVFAFLESIFFGESRTRGQSVTRILILFAVYLSGLIIYYGFLAGGDLPLTSLDWAKEMVYLDTLRVAMAEQILPWQWNMPFYHASEKFLANPEVTLTPDIFLLNFLSNSKFVVVHVVLFYSLGFGGLLLLARKFKFSMGAALLFWVLFNFNGHIISHLAVGHIQWTGYFLLPYFFQFLFRIGEESGQKKPIFSKSTLLMSLLFGFLLLNGSFHVFVWCAMFMVFSILWNGKMLSRVVASIVVGGLLGAGRLLGAALYFPGGGTFKSGYPSIGRLLDAFVADLGINIGRLPPDNLGWNEYDIFIGFTAYVMMGIFFMVSCWRVEIKNHIPFLGAGGILLILSLGSTYGMIVHSNLPFASIERVSPRFIIMPFLIVLITAARGADELFRISPKQGRSLVMVGMLFMAHEILQHINRWRVERIMDSFPSKIVPDLFITPATDSFYVGTVYVGWAISSLTVGLVIAFLIKKQFH